MADDIKSQLRRQLSEASSGVPELGIPPLDLPDFGEEKSSMTSLQEKQTEEVRPELIPPAPTPSGGEEPITLLTEDIEQISEAIIAEKWKALTKDIENMRRWQELAERNMQILQENMLKLDRRIIGIEQSIFQKVEEYNQGITDVGTELKAMQKVFSTMLPEFTENIKELNQIVVNAKKKPTAIAKKKK